MVSTSNPITPRKILKLTKEEFMYRVEIDRVIYITLIRPLQIIHSNVWFPFEEESLTGSKYYVTFIDDYTRCYTSASCSIMGRS